MGACATRLVSDVVSPSCCMRNTTDPPPGIESQELQDIVSTFRRACEYTHSRKPARLTCDVRPKETSPPGMDSQPLPVGKSGQARQASCGEAPGREVLLIDGTAA